MSDLQDIKCVDIKSDQMKCESSESLASDLMNTVMNGAGVDHKDQTEPWQCAGEPNCKKEEFHDLQTQCGALSHHCDINNEITQIRIVQNSTNSSNNHVHEPMISNSSNNPNLLNFFKNKTIHRHRGERLHKCTQCLKCFKTKSDLNVHHSIHTGEKPYKCTKCGKCFYTKSVLNVHHSIHTGEKPYKCTPCEKWCKKKSDLNIHLRIHSSEKPYKCLQCGKSFKRKTDLNVHLSIHTGEKPYKCIQCE
ncbi:hypothetical protein SKAU_G00425960, partial [Synaphobranchus kaupii]